MSNYWQKRLEELNKTSKTTNSSNKTSQSTGYWQQRKTELEKENAKKLVSGSLTVTRQKEERKKLDAEREQREKDQKALNAINSGFKADNSYLGNSFLSAPIVDASDVTSGGKWDSSVSIADKYAAVSRLILTGEDADYRTTDRLLKQIETRMNDIGGTWLNQVKNATEITELEQYYDALLFEKEKAILSETRMDGKAHSILRELELITELEGDEKKKRKEAVIDKLEELGIGADRYALFTDDKNFTGKGLWEFANYGVASGLTGFTKGLASTTDLLVGNLLKGVGWEDNPISTFNNYEQKLYETYRYGLNESAEKLGGGKGWGFAADATEGVVGAIPNAVLALMTSGASAAGSTAATSSSLATNAAYQSGNILTKAGITTSAMAKNPQFWLSYASTLGTDYEEAKNNGASDVAAAFGATLTSLINAGIEIGIDGGSGIQGLPGDLKGGDSSKILAWVESSLEEGGEEGLQKFVEEVVTKVAYDHDADILNPGEYAKEMALGTVAGSVLGGGQMTITSGVNAYANYQANKLTGDEKVVYNKVVDEMIAEKEKDGKKLSYSEKRKVAREAKNSIVDGTLSVDKIGEILGVESQKEFTTAKDEFFGSKDLNDYHKALQEKESLPDMEEQLAELGKQPNTVENNRKYDELSQKIAAIKNSTVANDLKSKLTPEAVRINKLQEKARADTYEKVKNTKLAESYREFVRSQEDLDIDVEHYTNENAKKTVQNIIDSGLGNNSKAFHRTVDLLAKLSADQGVTFAPADNAAISKAYNVKKGAIVHGFLTTDKNGKTITLNMESPRLLQTIAGHEITHVFEVKGDYDGLAQTVIDYAISKEGLDGYNKRIKDAEDLYKGMKDTTPEKEVVADLIGEYVFADTDFIRKLSVENRGMFDKLLNEIKYLYKIATAGSSEKRKLEQVKKKFEQVYRERIRTSTKSEAKGKTEAKTETKAEEKTEAKEEEKTETKEEAPKKEEPSEDEVDDIPIRSDVQEEAEIDAQEETEVETEEETEVETEEKAVSDAEAEERIEELNNQLDDLLDRRDDLISKAQDYYIEGNTEAYNKAEQEIDALDEEIASLEEEIREEEAALDNDEEYFGDFDDDAETNVEAEEVTDINDNPVRKEKWNRIEELEKQKDKLQNKVYDAILEGNTDARNQLRTEIKGIEEEIESLLSDIKAIDESAPESSTKFSYSYDSGLENGKKSKYNKKTKYSETETQFLIWERSSGNVGEVKKFVRFGKTHYYQKTENGCVELSRSQYNERGGRYAQENYRRAKREISETDDYDGSTGRGNAGYTDGHRDTGRSTSVFGQALEEEFSNDTGRSVSGAPGYDYGTDINQSEYDNEASGYPGASSITFSNDYQAIRNYMKEGDTGEETKLSMSKADSDYFDALERGDDEAAQKMVDEAAKAAGYTVKAYHGTKDSFTVFERGKYNQYDTGYLGSGFYFTDNKETAENYSDWKKGHGEKQTMNVALRMKNPLIIEDTNKPNLIAIQEALGLHLTDFGDYLASPNKEISDAITNEAKRQGYDGIIRYVEFFDETTYVVFDSNQVKSSDILTIGDDGAVVSLSERFNAENEDIRFSMSKSVEETKDLVALHNLTAEKLLKSLELGGLPMPSIAVTKADIPHDNFGEITLILGKDSIDPKKNKKNVVYSADAWTPVFPRVEYEADQNVSKQINSKLVDLGRKVEDVFKHDIDSIRYNYEDNLNRYGGEDGLIQYAMEKYGLKAAYLEDQGYHVDKITKQVAEEKKYNTANEAKYQAVAAVLDVNDASEIGKLNLKETAEQYGEQLEAIYPGITKTAMRMSNLFRQVQAYLEDQGGEPVYRTVTDENAMRKAIDDAIDMEGFEAWTRDMFSGIVKDKGIYNNKYLFTPSGNRKSFKQTHLPFTLENIVKAMASQNGGNTKNVSGFNGIKTLRAGTAERFKSIEAMHERKGRLQHLTQEEADAINDELSHRLYTIMESIDSENGNQGSSNSFIRFDSIGETLMEISEGGKYNVADIQGVFAKYQRSISDDLAADIKQLLFDVSQMPVNIYEAKPERAVSFDEVGVFVIPRNTDVKLKQELLNKGYSIAEYDPDVEGDRQKVVNQFEEYKFSLSPTGKESGASSMAEDGRYLKYRNPLDEFIPIREDAAQQDVPTQDAPTQDVPVDIPSSDDDWRESFDAITDEDAPPVMETPVEETGTVTDRIQQKIDNTQSELDKNRELREQSQKYYDEEIARLEAKYDSKKNKESRTAQGILRSIERLKRLKGNIDADYAKRISDLEARVEKMSSPEYRTAEQRRAKMEEHTDTWEETIGDTSTWKDMPLGLSYKTKTLRRILRKVVRGADGKANIELADKIYDMIETKYDHNEALLKRESQKVKAVFEKLNLNHIEDTYAHMLGELRHNPQTTLTKDDVDAFYNKHKKRIDTKKVDTAIDEARKTFDSLIVRVNEVLREQGFKEIPYRKGYFPHFTNPKQTWLHKLLNWKPVDNDVPTSIAGLTEQFKPQRSWQTFNKERKGDTTDYSLYQGLDTYIHGALDWIYHIDDLQSRRALENYLRYIHSDEGVKARIDEIKANEAYDADEAQTLIDGVLKEANNPLSGLVRELMNRTNTLANKKSSMDRGMEDATNRKVYSVMTNLNNRINANMVVGSFSSALTNFIPIVQSWHQVSPYFSARGLGDYVRSVVHDDGMIEQSDFLTNRLIEEEKLYKTGWDKVSDKAALMMNVIDSITSNTVWRSKYLQNIHEGMSEAQAIKDADQFAKNVMAGRSRGNAPTIFDAKNPLIKIATAFQLEVANQYGYMFDDVPKDSKNMARLVKGYATAFLGAYLYNAIYSSLAGRDAAFDPIGIIEDLLRDLFDEEEEPEDVALNFADNILEEVPFVGGLVGGGRIPISSALPYDGDYKSIVSDAFNDEIKVRELLKPLYYLALPVGGGQIKKTNEGLAMFDDDLPISGSYTDSGNLRFPVEDTFGNRVKAGMFGQYSSENAREYFANGYTPMNEKQIQEYKDLDIPIKDYWKYREDLSGLDTNQEKFDYIDGLDLPIDKKNILINNRTDRKEPVDMTDYGEYDSLEEFDFANANPEKYDFFVENGITYQDYKSADDSGKDAYNWAFKNPEKYAVSKVVTDDLLEYRKYTSDLNDIRADKDANGKTISGSAKEKKIDYINSLNIDYGAKLILFKTVYPSDDTYNKEIVEYLNSRSDFTYKEKVGILRELGGTVKSDGTVSWN